MAPPFAPALAPATWNTLIGGQGGPGFATGPQGCVGMQVNDFTLSSAQILALLGTPVTIIPAPGLTGWMIIPQEFLLRLIGGSAAFTDVGGAVSFSMGSASQALASNAIFLVTVSPNRAIQRIVGFAATDTAGNPPTDDNAPMNISKVTNNFAAGNGTMHITTYYNIDTSI
jgi:hypothetical protein